MAHGSNLAVWRARGAHIIYVLQYQTLKVDSSTWLSLDHMKGQEGCIPYGTRIPYATGRDWHMTIAWPYEVQGGGGVHSICYNPMYWMCLLMSEVVLQDAMYAHSNVRSCDQGCIGCTYLKDRACMKLHWMNRPMSDTVLNNTLDACINVQDYVQGHIGCTYSCQRLSSRP